jgi:aminopeptidase
MMDPRIDRLAEILVEHSCELQPGEKVLIEAFDVPDTSLVERVIDRVSRMGGIPYVHWKSNAVLRALYRAATEDSMRLAGEMERHCMERMNAYIGIRGAANAAQFSDVPAERMDLYQEWWWKPVHIDVRITRTKWVVLRYPTPSMAQSAGMSDESFADFYFSVCTADYKKMARDQEPLVRRMEAADRVRIVGPGTDLSFSIRGIPVRPCYGQRNIPDGEVFTAPVRTSVEGVIRYNAPSLYQGVVFDGVEFEFKAGKIVRATCANQADRLNQILDSDEGARYIGEWSIGCNNRVRRPMLDTLFDEKVGGSIHLTPGNAYDECDNGNKSRVHWDLVLIQTPEYGGGEIWFDGELIRKDGRFVTPDLAGLNDGL